MRAVTPYVLWCCCVLQNLQLLISLHRELIRNKFISVPCVFVHPACGEESLQLKTIVRKLGGTVAEDEGEGGWGY
jgi:hypothetical protein